MDATTRARELIDQDIAGQTLGDWLVVNAQQHGSKPALSWKEGGHWRTLTWRQYHDRVAEIAVGLAGLGVGHGDYVAIMAGNRPEHVLADAGIYHAGACPSTFYATLAADQIRYVATNCRAKVAILENRDFMKRWVEIQGDLEDLEHIVLIEHADEFADLDNVISYDDLLERGRQAIADDRDGFERTWRQVAPDDPATLIYTSGTTGPPKGVVLTHRNILWEAVALDRLTDLPSGMTGVSYLPLAHIAERMLSLYLALRKQAHLYFCPDTKQILEYVQESRPFFFFGVPRVWEKFRAGLLTQIDSEEGLKRTLAHTAIDTGMDVVRRQQEGRSVPPLLALKHRVLDRVVLSKVRAGLGLDRCEFTASAAAPLPVDVAEFFAGIGLPLLEVYGMTETTGVATGNRPGHIKIGTVGPALDGVEVTLGDDGEVLVRGPLNTPGYLNRPEATAELLDDDGWLHTGDIGEFDADGYLKIVDRKKELIITAGGKNLSPANIESLLKEHPLVGQALAYGDKRPYVVALVVLDEEVAPVWARERGLPEDVAVLAEHPDVLAEIEQAVASANAQLARVEQVKRFAVLPAEWTAESEELTPTLKLKRRVIHDKYAAKIEELYA